MLVTKLILDKANLLISVHNCIKKNAANWWIAIKCVHHKITLHYICIILPYYIVHIILRHMDVRVQGINLLCLHRPSHNHDRHPF